MKKKGFNMNSNHSSYVPMEITCKNKLGSFEFYWNAPEALSVTQLNTSNVKACGLKRLDHHMDRSFHRFARQIEWRGCPPRINGWMLNSLPSVPYFQPANKFNPYTSGYGHFLPVQTLPAPSQINLLIHLNSSGSMMSYDSLQTCNRLYRVRHLNRLFL